MTETEFNSKKIILNKIKNFTRSFPDNSRENKLGNIMQSNTSFNPESHALSEKFIRKLKNAKATVARVKGRRELEREIRRYAIQNQVKSTIVLANNDSLLNLEWNGVNVSTTYQPETITFSVVQAEFGIAETGTLLLKSSAESPTELNFLPDYHVVVLDSNCLVNDMEEAWCRVRKECRDMPRTINLVSGPSRTADIEYSIQLGAHGPKYLHVILVNQSTN